MTIDRKTGKRFPRGARPTPRPKLAAAQPFYATGAAPAQFAIVPAKLDVWGNADHGDCVSAEEAFAKACYSPEIFISSSVVIDWARRHGVLEGADLQEVMDFMQSDGFLVGDQRYNDGRYKTVDYGSESVLQAAIAQGPVKIAIDADALPAGAGNEMGWYDLGPGRWPNTDHCVSLSGYGLANWLFPQLGVTMPHACDGLMGYLLFTWGTIGFVTHPWLMGTCVEAWVRLPTTIGVPPLTPAPTPTPTPTPNFNALLTLSEDLKKGNYILLPNDAAHLAAREGMTPSQLVKILALLVAFAQDQPFTIQKVIALALAIAQILGYEKLSDEEVKMWTVTLAKCVASQKITSDSPRS